MNSPNSRSRPPPNDRIHIRILAHHIRERHRRDTLDADRVRHFLQGRRDTLLFVIERLSRSTIFGFPLVGFTLESTLADGSPGGDAHAFRDAHGEKVALEVAVFDGPAALVKDLRVSTWTRRGYRHLVTTAARWSSSIDRDLRRQGFESG